MAQSTIDSFVRDNQIAVVSKSFCPFCKKAKLLLDAEAGPGQYAVMEIDERPDTEELQQYLEQITGARSVPRVFIKGKCVGGAEETDQLQLSGELRQMVAELGLA
ncbi:hypothetical protein WJX72_006484 [[Myrmecia] bisecta]|uniref:Glutaredoxin domain-containing protein n=1 Tax=[Myrmecia] bisecta TaxID=41462 RepID=A0AAW1PHP0_9CHLO